ncbi:hypothetical protein N9N28_01155 [Rubripirellula amarantea]|uniref:Uncharacterized protein n=1 Tax=Rubripirellula amarantea TaxID=2527999 RepID=A0A5C5WFF1_9BACT|nr:hypothetical protein [Rubripirellula amarantea]MDA8743213.1 hypothetical protein [Rubripirellula amarantea]TWT49478.1 hypothetical protein Pla22_46750 [Rubripirellula amarantea]
MDSPLLKIDDKWVPLYRIVWVADVPHFCGEPDCMHEGEYEIRLDVDDSIWTNGEGRDEAVQGLTKWCNGPSPGEDEKQW